MDFALLSTLAGEVGLDLVGVAPIAPTPGWERYRAWLAAGYAGEMVYLTRADATARRADPRLILPEAASVLVVAATYAGAPHAPLPPLYGRVSRYAWGPDYHGWLLRRLETLAAQLQMQLGPFPARCYVDTGPVLERAWAQAAGLGWIGKNTNFIHPRLGSYCFLGAALVGATLPTTPPAHLPTCGTCTRCLAACPTGALIAPGMLDARRCLAYLSIELRGSIPAPLRPLLGEWVFGCDGCQDVCPWNVRIARSVSAPPPAAAALYLPELLQLDATTFRARFRHSPLWRATPEGLARNAAIVLGNRGDPAALPFLAAAARAHPSAIVREHAAWAAAQLNVG